MAQKGGGGVGKIILIVLAVLAGLGLLCAVGGWMLFGDYLKMGTALGIGSGKFNEQLQADLGPGSFGTFLPDDVDGKFVIVVGVPEDQLTPERIPEIQDLVWKAYAGAFADGGFGPVRLGVGKTLGEQQSIGWRENQITVEELVERTGVAAPATNEKFAELMAEQQGKPGIRVEITGGDEDD